MKTLLLAILVLACSGLLVDAKGFGHGGFGRGGRHSSSGSASHEKWPGGKRHEKSILQVVNATVQMILKVKSDQGTFVWDLLPPLLRFIILNQAQFQSDTFNVTEIVVNKKSNLLWSELPADIKTALLDEKSKNAFPSLTFEQLNMVSGPNDPLAKVTVKEILPKKIADLLPNITELLKDITFDTVINATKLKDALISRAPVGPAFLGSVFHKSQTRVCLWNLLMGGDSTMGSFNDLIISMISNANLKQMWQTKLLNKLNSHRMKLGNINELCYMLSMSNFLSRPFH